MDSEIKVYGKMVCATAFGMLAQASQVVTSDGITSVQQKLDELEENGSQTDITWATDADIDSLFD